MYAAQAVTVRTDSPLSPLSMQTHASAAAAQRVPNTPVNTAAADSIHGGAAAADAAATKGGEDGSGGSAAAVVCAAGNNGYVQLPGLSYKLRWRAAGQPGLSAFAATAGRAHMLRRHAPSPTPPGNAPRVGGGPCRRAGPCGGGLDARGEPSCGRTGGPSPFSEVVSAPEPGTFSTVADMAARRGQCTCSRPLRGRGEMKSQGYMVTYGR